MGTKRNIFSQRLTRLAVLIIAAVAVALFLLYFGQNDQGFSESLIAVLDRHSLIGPVILVLIMVFAVVVSPIPSAPITLAAGAAYGHFWGTIYALVGAEIGALIAFEIARRFARGPTREWISGRSIPVLTSKSQIGLSAMVLLTRLLPAVSFDVVSYAAGLTEIHRRWFAISTLFGMVPATFLLSHAGAGIRASEGGMIDILFALGALGLLTIGGILFNTRRNR